GEAPTGAWNDIEPVKKGPRQHHLMESVAALCGEHLVRAAFPKLMAEISERTFALIEQWRASNLLPKGSQAHVRQTLDCIKKVVDARLSEHVEAKIGPELIDLSKRTGLDILPILAFKKIVHHERIALIAENNFGGKVGAQRR